jgi:hypothetical protein
MVNKFSCFNEDDSATCQLNTELGHLVLNFHVPRKIFGVLELDPTAFIADHVGLGSDRRPSILACSQGRCHARWQRRAIPNVILL